MGGCVSTTKDTAPIECVKKPQQIQKIEQIPVDPHEEQEEIQDEIDDQSNQPSVIIYRSKKPSPYPKKPKPRLPMEQIRQTSQDLEMSTRKDSIHSFMAARQCSNILKMSSIRRKADEFTGKNPQIVQMDETAENGDQVYLKLQHIECSNDKKNILDKGKSNKSHEKKWKPSFVQNQQYSFPELVKPLHGASTVQSDTLKGTPEIAEVSHVQLIIPEDEGEHYDSYRQKKMKGSQIQMEGEIPEEGVDGVNTSIRVSFQIAKN